jgi:hypothetical protein
MKVALRATHPTSCAAFLMLPESCEWNQECLTTSNRRFSFFLPRGRPGATKDGPILSGPAWHLRGPKAGNPARGTRDDI